MQLRDKTIVLTGATSGIGRCLADRLRRTGRVIAVAREGTPAEALRAEHPDVAFVACDLSSGADVDALADTLLIGPPIDGFIHCAAVQNLPHLADPAFDIEAMREEVAINFTAYVHLCARLLPTLGERDEAFVLAVNSGLGLVPKRESAVYCATKGALDIFSQSLRAQLEGTRVAAMQAFLPMVETPMTEGRGSAKLSAEDVADRIVAGIERGLADNDLGKVRMLRAIRRASPALARRIMARG